MRPYIYQLSLSLEDLHYDRYPLQPRLSIQSEMQPVSAILMFFILICYGPAFAMISRTILTAYPPLNFAGFVVASAAILLPFAMGFVLIAITMRSATEIIHKRASTERNRMFRRDGTGY